MTIIRTEQNREAAIEFLRRQKEFAHRMRNDPAALERLRRKLNDDIKK